MRKGKSRPMWLLDLYLNKSPGVILIDGDSKKTPCLDLAFEIGTTVMEIGDAQRLCVWSWNGFHWAHDRHYLLTDDSAVDTHCWTVTKEDGIMPPALKPLTGTLIEDRINLKIRNSIRRCIHTPDEMDAELIEAVREYAGGITIVNHRQRISLENLARLNRTVKASGKTFVIVRELLDAQGEPYEATSYGELAMRISVEQGIDLIECAESIISLRERDYGRWRNYMPASILCRPLKIWNDDTCSDEFVIRCDENGRLNIVACRVTR